MAREQRPDLYRDAGDGFAVRAFYRPSLKRAGDVDARATVEVLRDGAALDALDVPAVDAFDVWRHAGTHSSAYADALAGVPA